MSTRKKKRRAGTGATTVPRRAAILRYLGDRNEPLNESVLNRAFNLRAQSHRTQLHERLLRMQVEGQILQDRRGRWALPARMDMVRGRVIGHKDGFGFLSPEQGSGDLYLSANEMRQVLHSDRVLARVKGVDRRGRREAHIVEVLERGNRTVVGRYVKDRKLAFVIPEDKRINQDIFVPPDAGGGALSGQIVVIELTRQPTTRFQPVGKVIEVLGEHMAPGMEIEIAIRKHGLPHEWPKDILRSLPSIPQRVSQKDCENRVDLRHLPLVTIDGEDARDFDDAVCCVRENNGWRLWVAIADVSHYVAVGSALDQEAYLRGNSVYFPQQVVPMLPEDLSNGICSLKPKVDRLCFVCEVEIGSSGELGAYRFYEAVMHSRARLTYTEVAAVLQGEGTAVRRVGDLYEPLATLYQLYKTLYAQRVQRNAIDLSLPETQILFNKERKIERIVPRARNDAHRLIEECMLAANICAADMLLRHQAPGVFRIHDRPAPEKVEDLRHFLRALGLSLGGGLVPEPLEYAIVVAASADRVDAKVIHTALLMSMSRAVYSAVNSGHFALAYDHYTHCTSPSRRYPDLYVHRVLKQVLTRRSFAFDDVDLDHLETAAEHCSMTERRADDATRDVEQWLKAEYMLDHVGDLYSGTVTNVTDFGVFVELKEVYVEGLVHVTALGSDYFHFDAAARRLVGERSGKTFRLGDTLDVRVSRVDLEQARIDFDLAETKPGVPKKRRKRRGRS